MKTLEYNYNNQRIEFLQGDHNIMVNATQMAKVFNKRIDFFLKSDNTKAFIRELKFPPLEEIYSHWMMTRSSKQEDGQVHSCTGFWP
jgi:hypothetical protein